MLAQRNACIGKALYTSAPQTSTLHQVTASDRHTLPRSTWGLLAVLTLGWGFNWPMMKLAVSEVPVFSFRALCLAVGALTMFSVAWLGGQRLVPRRGQWLPLAGSALLNVALWNVLIAYGVLLLPAGRSVILAYTMPLWTALLSAPLLHEALTGRRLLGVGLGTAGMLLLIGGELTALRAAPTGTLLVLGAALAWSGGTIVMKRYPVDLPTTAFSGWQMLIGGVPLVLGAIAFDRGRLHIPSTTASLAVLYNVFIAFIVCYWAWFKIVSRASAVVSSLGTLLIPVVGVVSSMVVLGERLTWQEFAAMALVLAAIGTVIVPPAGPTKR
jgi:drug/metabolite transporter (DMT)-like permease